MSLTVIELSAIFVDKIIFLSFGTGAENTAFCSSVDIEECKGNNLHLAAFLL